MKLTIPERQRPEDYWRFDARQGYQVRSCLKKKKGFKLKSEYNNVYEWKGQNKTWFSMPTEKVKKKSKIYFVTGGQSSVSPRSQHSWLMTEEPLGMQTAESIVLGKALNVLTLPLAFGVLLLAVFINWTCQPRIWSPGKRLRAILGSWTHSVVSR
jgi:hypothetical protein